MRRDERSTQTPAEDRPEDSTSLAECFRTGVLAHIVYLVWSATRDKPSCGARSGACRVAIRGEVRRVPNPGSRAAASNRLSARYAVSQHPDAVDFDLDHVAGFDATCLPGCSRIDHIPGRKVMCWLIKLTTAGGLKIKSESICFCLTSPLSRNCICDFS